jgi:hypothetical protein
MKLSRYKKSASLFYACTPLYGTGRKANVLAISFVSSRLRNVSSTQ